MGINENEISDYDNVYEIDLDEEEQGGPRITPQNTGN